MSQNLSDSPERSNDPVDRYRAAVLSTARRALGSDVVAGATTVVPSAEREGSTAAVAYPLGERTLIWCSPDLAPRLAPLNRAYPLTVDQFADEARQLGGVFLGSARNRVLTTEPAQLSDDRYRVVGLDRNRSGDRRLLEAFIAASSPDDLDEAELDIDDLDPAIVAVVDDGGSIASYASGRPWSMDPDFDDIGVITHPQHRGRRLGSVAVSHFARQQQRAGRLLFYNCNVDNHGSNRVAETVGFEVMNVVVAFTFE